MARKFLYVVATLIVLTILGLLAYRLFSAQLFRAAMVPSASFVEQRAMPANRYADASMWHARPDIADNAALWLPEGFDTAPATPTTETATPETTPTPPPPATTRKAAIFFIHPTSYLDRSAWNAPLNDPTANERARLFIRGQASAFNGVGQIWAPKYRQATFGAFLTTQENAQRAIDAAYLDVLAAFDQFVVSIELDRPIILAGHSQGALHLTRLLRERIASKPIAKRIVAAYVVGWPVSIDTDIAALGLPACQSPEQAGCLLSWQSFAEPADTSPVADVYNATTGFDGRPRLDTRMLCTNPLTGIPNTEAPATANLGNLVPDITFANATLDIGVIPARCDERGFLLIGPPPEKIGTYVLPGNNYHVFDYSLFWSNVRADAARRFATFISPA